MENEPRLYVDEDGCLCYLGPIPYTFADARLNPSPTIYKYLLTRGQPTASGDYPKVCHIDKIKTITIKPTTLIITSNIYQYFIPHTPQTYRQLQEILSGK